MKVRLAFICNSSSSDFVAVPWKARFLFDEKCIDDDYFTKQFDPETMGEIKRGSVITLESTRDGWTKDFEVVNIMDVDDCQLKIYALTEV